MKKIISSLFLFSILHSLLADDLPIIEYGSINHPVISDNGMVVSQRMIASEVGASVFMKQAPNRAHLVPASSFGKTAFTF